MRPETLTLHQQGYDSDVFRIPVDSKCVVDSISVLVQAFQELRHEVQLHTIQEIFAPNQRGAP